MKRTILLSSVAVMSAVATFAQTKAPQSFNYQGALRKPEGTPLAGQKVGLRLSIVKDTPNGEVEYYETRTVETNALGLYSVQIGSAGATTGTTAFNQIAWGAGDKYFKVEVDPNGGIAYVEVGTSPILSVPYALYAAKGGTSAYNYWANLPENAGKTEAQFITYLKDQAASGVAADGKNLTATSDIAGILSITGGDGSVLKAAEIKLNKTAFDQAARQAAIDGLNGTATDATAQGLKDAVQNAVKDGLNGTNGTNGALSDAVATTINNLITEGKINGKSATVDNAATNADGSILAFNSNNEAVLKDLKLMLDKTALNNETKQSIIDGLNGLDGTNGVNGIDGKLQDAINKAVTNGLNGLPGTDGSNGTNGANGALAEAVTKIIEKAIAGDAIKGQPLTTQYPATTPDANKFLSITGNGADALLKDAGLAIDPNKFNQAVSDAITGANGANGADGANGTNGTNGVGKDLGKTPASATVLDIVAVDGGKNAVLSNTSLGIDKAGFDDAAKQAVTAGILNGKDGAAGANGVDGKLADAINTIIKESAKDNLTVAAPGAMPTGATDVATNPVGTVTPGTDTTPAVLTINAAGEKAKGVVSNEDIKNAITNGLNAANTTPAGTTAGDPAVNQALNDAVNNAIKNGKDANGETFAKKLSTDSFITASVVDNKALLQDLTIGVDQNKLNEQTAKTLVDGLTPAPTDGSTNNPLADAIKDVIKNSILNGADGAAGTTGNDGTNGANGKDGALADAVKTIIKETATANMQFTTPAAAPTGAADVATAASGTVVSGTATEPAKLTLNAAGNSAKGVVSLDDVRAAVAGGAAGTDRLDKGAVTGADVVQAGTQILNVDANTNSTFQDVNIKLNKTALANTVKQSVLDGINGTNGADGTNGTDGINKQIQDAITKVVKEQTVGNLELAAPGAKPTGAADVATAKTGTVIPGTATTPASIVINAAGENAKGVVSLADIKAAVAGTGTGAAAATAVQDVKATGANAAALTITKDPATNIVSVAPNKATDATPGVVTLNDVRAAVAGNGATNRLDKGTIAKIAGADNILTIAGTPANSTFQDVSFGVTKGAVQTAITEGLVGTGSPATGVNPALVKAVNDVVKQNAGTNTTFGTAIAPLTGADAGKGGTITPGTATTPATINLAKAGDTTPGVVSKQDIKDVIAGTNGNAGIGAALTSTDITVTGGDKAVLNATTLAIKDGAITASKIAAGAVTNAALAPDAVTSDKVKDGSLTGADLAANTITGANIAPKTVGAANMIGGTTGQVPTSDANGVVTWAAPAAADASSISNKKAITSSDLTVTNGAGSVLSSADVTLAIKDGAITAAKIAPGAVTNAALAPDAVTTDKIAAGAVTNSDLAPNAVTSDKILDGTVAAADLAKGAVTADKLGATAADAGKVPTVAADGTVTYQAPTASAANVTGGQNVTAGSTKVTLGGTPAGAALKAFSIDVNEANLNLANIGGALPVNKIAATAADAGKVPTVAANGTVTYQAPTASAANVTGAQDLSVAGLAKITAGTGTGATLKAVTVSVSDADVQGSIVKGLGTDANANQALKDAVKANAPTIAAATPSNGVTVAKDAAGNYTIGAAKATDTTPGTVTLADAANAAKAAGAALTSADITVTGGDEAVLNATTLAIKDGAITASKIAAGAVTNAALAPDAVTTDKVKDGSLTGADLANGSVAPAKLAATAADAGKVATVAPDGTVTWTAPAAADASSLANKKDITSSDLTVTGGVGSVVSPVNVTLAIKDGAITASKLAAGAVTNTALAADAVTTDKVKDGSLTGADLAPKTITAANLLGGSAGQVPTSDANGVVTWAAPSAADASSISNKKAITSTDIKVVNGAGSVLSTADVTLAINDGAITASKLAAGAVTNTALAADAVTTDKVKDGSLTGADLAPKTIAAANLDGTGATAGQVPTVQADGTVKYAAPATSAANVTGGQDVTAGSTKVTLGGTPAGAALKAFSVDVNEANLNLANIGGKLPVTKLGATATDAGKVPTVDAAGNVTYQTPTAANASTITNKKDITSSDITVGGGAGSVVSAANVTLTIANNAINSAKIADGTVTGTDLAPKTVTAANMVGGTAGQVPTSDANGVVTYKDANSLVVFDQTGFNATAGTNTYTVASLPADVTKVFVFRNGAKLEAKADYTVAAGQLTIIPTNFVGGALATNDRIEVQFAK